VLTGKINEEIDQFKTMKKIEFKFHPGDECFTINNGKVKEGSIHETSIKMVGETVDIKYSVQLKGEKINRTEDYVFKTKDELIASL